MTTFKDITDQVHSMLHSYTGVQESTTWLTAAATNVATSLTVNDSFPIAPGISEVDEELVYVSDASGNTLTLAPWGRGVRGTVAAAHTSNAKVTFNPTFPRFEIKRAINQCLASVYPLLYQTKSTTFTFDGVKLTYDLPADCDQVVKVIWQVTGPSNYWETIFGWQFEPNSQELDGKALTLVDLPMAGRTVKVVYQAAFGSFVNDTDTFASVGFPESAVDVLLYGAASKLIRFLDVARLQLQSVENISRGQLVQAGDPAKIANQFYAMYQQRLNEERAKLLQLNPPQLHFTR